MDESGSGRLVVLSGPSGAGKTTACDRLQADPAITRAITATTRAPRAGEVDGVHYFFFDEESFRKGIEEGKFLEHAEVHGRFYGTPKEHLEELIASGRTVLLSIDVQGMVNDGNHGSAHGLNSQQAPREALIVEHDVEAVSLLKRGPASHQTKAEGLHFGENTEP